MDYIDEKTGLLYCGKCSTRKETYVNFGGEKRKVKCLCRCQTEENDKEKSGSVGRTGG